MRSAAPRSRSPRARCSPRSPPGSATSTPCSPARLSRVDCRWWAAMLLLPLSMYLTSTARLTHRPSTLRKCQQKICSEDNKLVLSVDISVCSNHAAEQTENCDSAVRLELSSHRTCYLRQHAPGRHGGVFAGHAAVVLPHKERPSAQLGLRRRLLWPLCQFALILPLQPAPAVKAGVS